MIAAVRTSTVDMRKRFMGMASVEGLMILGTGLISTVLGVSGTGLETAAAERSGGFGQQEPVFRRDFRGNLLCANPVTLIAKPDGSRRINGERCIHPPGEVTRVTRLEIVTARQNREPRTGPYGALDYTVRQRAARMARHDDVDWFNRDVINIAADKNYSLCQPWPRPNHHFVNPCRGHGQCGVYGNRDWACVIQEQHHVRQQGVAGSDVNHPAAAKQSARTPRHLPGFEKLLPWQASGLAYRAANAIEQRFGGKPAQIMAGQPRSRPGRKGCSCAHRSQLIRAAGTRALV
jgi:hypothetical protein